MNQHITEEHLLQARIKLGLQIRNIRESKGFTVDQVCKLVNIDKQLFVQLEAGKWNFDINKLMLISKILEFELLLN